MAITKALEGKGTLDEKEYLKKLEKLIASETAAEEKSMSDFMDMKYEEALDKYLKNNPGKTEQDYIEEVIRRVPLRDGGKIIDFSKYRKTKNPKIKELKLSDVFTPETTLAELDDNQRATLNTLLKLTFGKKD
jgi:hypothetical protein|tara:strand:- start:72 stop:470 length:399 start_codon:yes stop_codon:yes gene_type:complete